MITSALPGPDGDEFDMLEGGVLFGGHHQAGAARQARQQLGRLGQHVLDAAAAAGHPGFDGAALIRRQIADFQQAVDKQPQTLFGRHPAGAGMGGIEQAHRFQVRHHVADRGGRQGKRQALGQGAGTHRLADGQKGLHQMAEHFARALAKARRRQMRRSTGVQTQAFEMPVFLDGTSRRLTGLHKPAALGNRRHITLQDHTRPMRPCNRAADAAAHRHPRPRHSPAMPKAPAWSNSAIPMFWSPPAWKKKRRPSSKARGKGWVTAEYGMLPRSTHERMRREAAAGKQSGRTQEIQRLVGRSLRAVCDLAALGERQIVIDCDVLQADGGTRTAAITGGFIALQQCVGFMKKDRHGDDAG